MGTTIVVRLPVNATGYNAAPDPDTTLASSSAAGRDRAPEPPGEQRSA
jgi:hypothetical protein